MSATFLLKRGKRAVRRAARAHLARFNAHGQVAGTWCGYTGYDLSSNVPWGCTICKHCIREASRDHSR